MFCHQCGKEIPDQAAICIHCGVATQNAATAPQKPKKSHIGFILLGFFLGTLGIHNFYAGYMGKGIAQLLITLFLWWLVLPIIIVWVWNIVEIITVKTDADGKSFV